VIAAASRGQRGLHAVAFYVIGTFVVSLFIVWLAKEGAKVNLHHVGPETHGKAG
jgi:hypothetical protein